MKIFAESKKNIIRSAFLIYINLFLLSNCLLFGSIACAYNLPPSLYLSSDSANYVVLSNRIPFKNQITQSNTVYDIRYDFDLNGDIVTIPINCVLAFNGGKIRNGTLKGSNTIIRADARRILGNDLFISGSWGGFVAYAKWFGNTTNDIQKCINSFGNKTINIDGDWLFNGTIEIPYDTYIQVNNGSIKATSSGTIMKLYIGYKTINLQNLRIDLENNFEGTCVEVFGCNHPDIRGFLDLLQNNISESHIYLPIVSGGWKHRENVKNATAIKVHCKEDDGDILYFKHIHSSVYSVTTGLRLEDMSSGINSTTFYVEAFFARTGISLDRNLQHSTVVYLFYQDYNKSYKAIQIDNNKETYRQHNKGTYYIRIYDEDNHLNLIDNCLGSAYLPYQRFEQYRIDRQFVNKPENESKDPDGATIGVKRCGTFNEKPEEKDIYVGFKYFCTDRRTQESDVDGIEIIYKGSNVWVDALGRIIK